MRDYNLRVVKSNSRQLYFIEVWLSRWLDINNWTCIQHFKTKEEAQAFVTATLLTSPTFDTVAVKEVHKHFNSEKTVLE